MLVRRIGDQVPAGKASPLCVAQALTHLLVRDERSISPCQPGIPARGRPVPRIDAAQGMQVVWLRPPGAGAEPASPAPQACTVRPRAPSGAAHASGTGSRAGSVHASVGACRSGCSRGTFYAGRNMPGEGRKRELLEAAHRFFDGGAGKDGRRRGGAKAASRAASASGALVVAVAVRVGLAGVEHGRGIVLMGCRFMRGFMRGFMRCFVRGVVHSARHRHIVRQDVAVSRGMMAHAAFEPRHSRDALHGQGDDEQGQEK